MATFETDKAEYNTNDNRLWIWKNWIPYNGVTVLAGDSGSGKSRALASILACALKKEQFPDGEFPQELPSGKPFRVMLINTESDNLEVGDTYRVQGWTEEEILENHLIMRNVRVSPTQLETFDIDNPKHIEALREKVKDFCPTVIILDPLVEFNNRNSISDRDIRALLTKLGYFAREWQVAIIAMIHFNKNEKQSYGNRIAGSHQFNATVRSTLLIFRDKNNQRVFNHYNVNNAPPQPDLGFTIQPPDGMVIWGKLAHPSQDGESKTYQAEQWLKEYLTKYGEMPIAECIKVCSSMFSERVLRQARHNVDFDVYTRWVQVGPVKTAHWGIRNESNLWGIFKLNTHA